MIDAPAYLAQEQLEELNLKTLPKKEA